MNAAEASQNTRLYIVAESRQGKNSIPVRSEDEAKKLIEVLENKPEPGLLSLTLKEKTSEPDADRIIFQRQMPEARAIYSIQEEDEPETTS